ncbi:MAG: DUF4838 domain-containing protein [Candidatus Hydrogenedentota bacterium]
MHLTLSLVMFLAAQVAGEAVLSQEGATDWAIVVAEDAIAPEQTAARELQEHLEAVTGASFAIQNSVGEGEKAIVVGPSAEFVDTFPEIDLNALGHDGIVMKSGQGRIYLAGGRPRGTLYAVYTFLEDVVGCRWWSATERYVPKNATLRVPALDEVYSPALIYREAYYRGAFDGVYAARSKCNGHFEQIPEEYGGHYNILGWCHTFYQLMPPEKYFSEHPEWYSEIDGERRAERAQLCLTNEAMRAEFVRNALEWIRKNPEAGMISISQNDCHGYCQCPKCRAQNEAAGSPSGSLLHFVNAVAAEIEKEYPDFLIMTLAYQYTRQAPEGITPRDNVIIRLCSIESSFSQPLATGPQNVDFKRDMEAWSAMAPNLFVWNYVTNFRNYILPHPNLRVLAPNIRFFVDNKAVGLFEQGDSSCSISDFPELRAWLLAHLMWDPSRDAYALMNEFLEGYYGPAAAPLRGYIDLIHDAAAWSGVYLRCYMSDTSAWLPLEDVARAVELFDDAERLVADDPILAKRVARARMPLDNVLLNRYYELKRAAKRCGTAFPGPSDPMAFAEDFIARAEAFDANSYREGGGFGHYAKMLRARFRPPGPLPAKCENLSEEDYIVIEDNRCGLHGVERGWSALVEDGAAADKGAAKMPANHTQWAVQYEIREGVSEGNPWHCYVELRCEAKVETGTALTVGIYDSRERKGVTRRSVPIAEVAGKDYTVVDLGVHDLSAGMYFWVAPVNNPEEVEAVYVDRFFMVREQ